MFFSRPAGHKYVDRGDPSGADFDETDLTVKGTWTEIDLSSIVPIGAVAVAIALEVDTAPALATIQFRKKGNTNFIEGDGLTTQILDKSIRGTLILSCDSDRKIEYMLGDATWNEIDFVVKGWFI